MPTLNHLRRLTLVYAAILLSIILAANAGVLPVKLLLHLPGGDKLGHFVLMGMLSFLVNLSLGALDGRRFNVLWGSLGLWLVVALEELSQIWLVTRRFELPDLAADTAGIFVFAVLARHCLGRYGTSAPGQAPGEPVASR